MSKATYKQPGRPWDDFDGEEYEEFEEYEEAGPDQGGPVEAEAYDDTGDEEYDEVYDEEEPYEQPAGIFATPARTITLVASILVLLVVFGSMAWLIGQRGNPNSNGGNVVQVGTTNSSKPQPKVGSPAPDFELADVTTGESLKLSSLKGKPVLVNFWGTWCPPCRAEMPEMQKLYDELKDQVEFVGVSMGPRDSAQGVEQFVKLDNYTWKFVHDPDLGVMENYRVTGIPSSYFIDKDGIIRAIHVGGADYTLLEGNLQKAMNTQ